MIENTPENDALRDFSVSSRKYFARAALDPGILRFRIIFSAKNVEPFLNENENLWDLCESFHSFVFDEARKEGMTIKIT